MKVCVEHPRALPVPAKESLIPCLLNIFNGFFFMSDVLNNAQKGKKLKARGQYDCFFYTSLPQL